jgi:hypothetical protein
MTIEIRRSGDVAVITEPRYRVEAREQDFSVTISSAIVMVTGDPYEGAYTVVPMTSEQVLRTKAKTMLDDVTVTEIPYQQTTNEAGGYTVSIAS